MFPHFLSCWLVPQFPKSCRACPYSAFLPQKTPLSLPTLSGPDSSFAQFCRTDTWTPFFLPGYLPDHRTPFPFMFNESFLSCGFPKSCKFAPWVSLFPTFWEETLLTNHFLRIFLFPIFSSRWGQEYPFYVSPLWQTICAVYCAFSFIVNLLSQRSLCKPSHDGGLFFEQPSADLVNGTISQFLESLKGVSFFLIPKVLEKRDLGQPPDSECITSSAVFYLWDGII